MSCVIRYVMLCSFSEWSATGLSLRPSSFYPLSTSPRLNNEVMITRITSDVPSIESYLAQYRKSVIINLGVNVEADLKLDSQIQATVKTSFFQLRQKAKVKSILSREHSGTVIHDFVATWLDQCNALYLGG